MSVWVLFSHDHMRHLFASKQSAIAAVRMEHPEARVASETSAGVILEVIDRNTGKYESYVEIWEFKVRP